MAIIYPTTVDRVAVDMTCTARYSVDVELYGTLHKHRDICVPNQSDAKFLTKNLTRKEKLCYTTSTHVGPIMGNEKFPLKSSFRANYQLFWL